jgi:CubicO group peptidase (beta-lactamase class C family)
VIPFTYRSRVRRYAVWNAVVALSLGACSARESDERRRLVFDVDTVFAYVADRPRLDLGISQGDTVCAFGMTAAITGGAENDWAEISELSIVPVAFGSALMRERAVYAGEELLQLFGTNRLYRERPVSSDGGSQGVLPVGMRFEMRMRVVFADEEVWERSASASCWGSNQTTARDFHMTGSEQPAFAVFDSTVVSFMQRHGVTGGALAVSKDGEVLHERGYTYRPRRGDIIVEPASLFRIASISKPLTAVAILELVERGDLQLSDRVQEVLGLEPRRGDQADPRLGDITIRHLLQHLGGWDRRVTFDPMFRDEEIARALGKDLPISQQDIITYMNGQELQHEPGTTEAYSNYGYLLLGRVIEKVSGRDYEDFVTDEILRPIGVTTMRLGRSLEESRFANEVVYHAGVPGRSVFSRGERVRDGYGTWNLENMDAHGGWLSSAGDLARFASSFDRPDAHPVLEPSSIEQMYALPEHINPESYERGSVYYGLGWSVRDYGGGKRNAWHGGALSGTYTLMVRRQDGVGWVVLFNRLVPGIGEIDGLLHQAAGNVREWPGSR